MAETVFNEGSINGTDFRIESDDNANMFFVDSADDRIGIGTASPETIVHITGLVDDQLTSGTTSYGTMTVETNGSQLAMGSYESSPWPFYLQASTASDLSSYRNLLLNPLGGNVGIGTTSPAGLLEVENSSGDCNVYITAENASNSRLYFGDQADVGAGFVDYDHDGNTMKLGTNGTTRLTVDDKFYFNGNVGISESNPGYRLHIGFDGAVAYNGATDLNGESAVYLQGQSADGEAVMIRWANHGAMNNYFGCVQVGSSGPGDFVFTSYDGSSAYAERMRIKSNSTKVTASQYGLGINCDNAGELSTSGTDQRYLSVDGGSNGGVVELRTSQNGNDYFMGAIEWVNAANGDSSNNDADGRLVCAITSHTKTSDSNSGDDSGGHMLFYTKPEAGNLTLRWSFKDDGQIIPYGSIIPASNNSYNLGSTSYRWSVLYTSNAVNVSDKTLKTDIQDCDLGIDFINTLKPKSFKMKNLQEEHDDYNKKHYGLIAQDLKDGKLKDSVYGDKDGDYGLAYNDLVAPLVKAVQELSAKVEALENA